jgi:pepF/M3 family oligoendopeptidase
MTTTISRKTTETLPRWDLESLFPGPTSPELRAAIDGLTREIAELEALFDRHGVGTANPGAVDDTLVAAVEEVLNGYNALLDVAGRINGYFYCLVAADVRDEEAAVAASEWRQRKAGLARLAPRFSAWVGRLDVDALAERSALVSAHASVLRRVQTAAAHLMPAGEEELAAELGPSAAAAWMSLRDELAGRATARIELDGKEQELPLSEIANLRYREDRDLRRRADEAAKTASQQLAVPLAAALNGVKGQQITLARRRGWDDPLDQALFDNAIDSATLDAMQTATREAIPDFQRYLRAKARLLGLPVLAAYDVDAPVGEDLPWPYERSQQFIIETFAAEHPKLGALAERAFAESWIDAEPRAGKDSGAFCVAVGGDASRIFINYLPVYDQMGVLAHEIGHAYHNRVTAEMGRTPLQFPPEEIAVPLALASTLAETASTICEALVLRAARKGVTPAQELAILDGWLQTFTTLVFGIHARFILEREAFARRKERNLSPRELDEIMAGAWREVVGDAIAGETLSTTDWMKPHFFMDNLAYYNFPYAFGVLFAIGLLAVRDADPDGFYDRYDNLLADAGIAEAPDLAARFGIDLRSPAFWRTSLDSLRADVDRYEELARVTDDK